MVENLIFPEEESRIRTCKYRSKFSVIETNLVVAGSRQGESHLRSPGSISTVRETGPSRLPLQGESALDESTVGEGRVPVRSVQRAGGVLQKERFPLLQQSGRDPLGKLHVHALQRAGHRGAQPIDHRGESLFQILPPHFRSNRSQLIREKLGADRAEAACIHRHPPTLVHKEVGGEFGDTLRREGRGPVSQALDRLVQGEQFCRNETFLLSPPFSHSRLTRLTRGAGWLADTVDQQDDYNRWQLDDRQDTGAGQGIVPMRGEQRGRDGGRGHGIDGVERAAKGAVQLERQQQQ